MNTTEGMHGQVHEIFVSPQGNDGWSGTLRDPKRDGSDGPFASLARARDAIRELKSQQSFPAHGLTVWLRGGDHVLERTFTLTREDSGVEGGPIVYRAVEGEEVRLLGAQAVKNFVPVSDWHVLQRLDEEARHHVLQANLRAHGITNFGLLRSRGFARPAAAAHMELFFGGRPMTLARWPNDGFLKIAAIPEESKRDDDHGQEIGELEAGFHYEGDRPERWHSVENVWVHGYWAWDWANSYEGIATLDSEKRLIRTKPPHGSYGFRVGQRFYFLNILEELDGPGEYYVDQKEGILYFWPPEPPEGVEALVSILETPMISMTGVSWVTVRGLTLEATRGCGIRIEGGSGVLLAGCTLRNIGNDAVVIEGGARHGVVGCDIYEVADRGISISGGDRSTLTPCGHYARNNHLHHFSRWSRTYCPAIDFTGVGVCVAHNLIHEAPHTAIAYLANESVIELNEIHHVTMETGDCGAIYTGRDFTARGNVIRHNYIHDTGGYGMGSMGVYLDDCASGQTVFGNIFVRTTRAAFIGGGRDNVVENNIFVDCVPAVHVDGRGLNKQPTWHDMVYKTMKERLEAVDYRHPPYSERYPELLRLDEFYASGDGIPPGGNVIARNVCAGGRWLDIVWDAEEEHLELGENLNAGDPRFFDPAGNDFRLRDDSPAWSLGFTPIPTDSIGLVRDEYRATLP